MRLIETYWQMRGLLKPFRVLTCALYESDEGLEVQVAYSDDDRLQSQRVKDRDEGRWIAQGWKDVVVEKGGFEELPST